MIVCNGDDCLVLWQMTLESLEFPGPSGVIAQPNQQDH